MTDKQKFAAFDIDGTIYRYALFQILVEHLVEDGVLPEKTLEQYESEMAAWKNRTHSESFYEFAMAQVRVFDDHITQVEPAELEKTAAKILKASAGHVYVFTRDLIASLKEQGYFLIAISGSVSEIAEPFAKMYHFDAIESSTYERKDGKYTGNYSLRHADKHTFIEDLMKKHNLTLKGSIGVGDSMGDVSMLDMVEQPIAFNPEKKLLEEAKQRGWKVVVERKNVSYELEKGEHGYTLAKTN